AACSPKPTALPEGQLEQSVASVPNSPPCDSVIPMEWPATWPIPTGAKAGREFKLLFYPKSGRQGDRWLGAPLAEAVFEAGAPGASSCRRLAGAVKKIAEQIWSPEVAALKMDAFEAESQKLYASLSETAPLYAAKKPLSQDQSQRVQACASLLTRMVQPGLAAYYYRMNPDFWEWLRSSGASSLPKP
ncbi:MAG: hypothetical protein PHU21_06125, partial [Elusimicrobia bacterium]|nr:hypothetical protein [Elusimicrobiota bacterium]